jgi:transposase
VTPGLLAFLFVNKYVDHLPFYRQEKRFERIGIQISRQDMSFWQRKVFEALEPLFELLKKHIKSGPVLQMDETPVQVMKEPDRPDTRKSYMWLARGGPPDQPVVLYTYRETRGANHIEDLVAGFSGYLQTDGYEAYETVLKGRKGIVHVGCFAHARRKFVEASKGSKKAGSAQECLKRIGKIYAIERELRARELSADDFLAERNQQVEPVLGDLKAWLEKKAGQVPPQTLIGKAVHYTLGQWEKLIRYLDHPELTPDNNAAENAIRPFVLGRKNWLFSGSPAGAESSCGMYSLIETAKQNGLSPYFYLFQVFEKAPFLKNSDDWKSLLPWNIASS